MPGTLYVVATPIGNLADISNRALTILGSVDLIACEDTRHTHKLLQHYGIKTKTISYHEHNEAERATKLVELIEKGSNIAIVSDAGTPAINDPGFRLVKLAIDANLAVVPVPGPSALVAALVSSGLPTDQFFFAGFLPSRSNARRTRLAELRSIPATLIFYETPHRLAAALKDAHEVLGDREAAVARELTKLHEETRRGRLSELATHFSDEEPRGEIVLVIDRHEINDASNSEVTSVSVSKLVDQLESEGLDHRAALKKAARELGLSRAEAYRRLVAEKGN